MPPLPAAEQRAIALYRTASPSILALHPTPTTFATAFIWSPDHIITCAHVLPPTAIHIPATLPDRTTLTLTLLHKDLLLDIALLAASPGQPPLPRAKAPPRPGQACYVLTSGRHAGVAIAGGLVSATGVRAKRVAGEPAALEGLLQVDVPANRGASGAPLLDSAGRVVGMVVAIASESGAFEGVTYAIPVDVLERVAGCVRRGRL